MKPNPPRLADRLLRFFCAPHRLEEVQGDLHEEFAYQVNRIGERRARWRYWRDVLGFVKPFALKRKPTGDHRGAYSLTYLINPDMLQNYIKIAFRQLWRNRLYSLLNIGGLALGMACCLLIALYVYDEWSYDRFNANYDHIYRVTEKQKQAGGVFDVAVTPGPLAPALAKDFPEVLQATRVGQWSGLLTQGRQSTESDQMLIVDSSFFSLFSFPLLAGNLKTIFRSPDEVIFSEAMAKRIFGENWQKKNVLGQSFTVNNEQTLTLVGVVQNAPTRSHIQFEVLLPFRWVERYDQWGNKWNSNNYHTYVQLRPGPSGDPADPIAFGEKIKGQLKRYDAGNDAQLVLQPLSAIYLHSTFAFRTDFGKRSDITYVRIFVAVGLIVLLIAVVNFINLATARASQRAKEVGVRKTVGAQRSSLIGQFLGEAFLMTGLAVTTALLIADVLMPLFNDLSGKTLQIPYQLPVFWPILIGLTGVVSLLTGLYPAFFLSAFRPARVLKGIFNVQAGRGFRQSLVIGQFVFAITLAISTLFIYRQLAYLQSAKLGFDKSQLLYVRLKGDLRAKAMVLKNEISRLPGVAQASVATSNLVDISNETTIDWQGQIPKDEFLITQMNIDADFMKLAGMSLAAGRNFSNRITADTSSRQGAYLINETAARRMGWTPTVALGKRVKFWGMDGNVIGVLKDFHFQPLRVAIKPFIFRFRPKDFYFTLLVKTTPGTVSRTLTDVTKVYKKLDPDHPISYGFVDQDVDAQYRAEQRTGRIILYFSILTILVSCLGLFGLAAFTAEQRTKEIGIRKVLGASIHSIVVLLSKDFLKLVGIAIVIASPIAWWAMSQWLQNFAYKIDMDWWVFAGAGLLAVSIALLTVSVQSIKAALMNPVKSLRSE
ncbi:permease prefix domain 2-containing transporter [Spirosoma areae]